MRGKMLCGKRARVECPWGCCRDGVKPEDKSRLRRMARRRENRDWKKEEQ